MTADQKFGLTISLLSLVFVVMTGILGVLIKVSMTWGRSTQQLKYVVDDLGELKDDFANRIGQVILSKEREHDEMRERLTYLERRELTERRKGD